MPSYSQTDPNSASGFNYSDDSANTWVAYTAASATSSEFDTHVTVDSRIIWEASYGPSFNNTPPQESGSFSMTWAGNGQTGSLFTMPNLVSGNQSAAFQFVYATPYTIQGLLSLSARCGPSALGLSSWSDTFTFYGGAPGTIGTADFNLAVNGSSTQSSGTLPPMPWSLGITDQDILCPREAILTFR